MMWNYNDWWQFGMGYGIHWIFMLAIWGLVIWAVVALVKSFGRSAGRSLSGAGAAAKGESPQAILERRFARGELNASEFKKMTDTLAKSGR